MLMLIAFMAIWISHVIILPSYESLRQMLYENRWIELAPIAGIILLTIFNSFLLRRFVLHFSIIRIKSFLPVFFFLVFTLTWPDLRVAVFPHFFLTVFLICLDLLFSSYRNPKAVEIAFLSSLLIAVTSLIHPLLLVCVPLFWLTLVVLKSMSIRMWLASLTGVAAPWLIFSAWHWWQATALGIAPELLQLNQVEWFFQKGFNIHLGYFGLIAVIFLFCITGLFNRLLDDSIQTRKYIHLLLIILLLLTIFNGAYPQLAYLLLPVVASILAILMAHPFTLRKSPLYTILFLVFGLLNIFYLLSQYIQFYY